MDNIKIRIDDTFKSISYADSKEDIVRFGVSYGGAPGLQKALEVTLTKSQMLIYTGFETRRAFSISPKRFRDLRNHCASRGLDFTELW